MTISGTFLETECANSIGEDQKVGFYLTTRQPMQRMRFKGKVLGKDGERGCCQLQGGEEGMWGAAALAGAANPR